MDPFLGEIRMFGGNFAPRGWALCNGQLLSINTNTALFSLLGVTYGGNGQSTFGLPNLQGRVPMHWGQGAGLTPRTLGEQDGTETVTLNTTQMPAHNHVMQASGTAADQPSPVNNYNAVYEDPNTGTPVNLYGSAPNAVMNPQALSVAGGSQPHPNVQPFQCVSFIIALEGIFPPRD